MWRQSAASSPRPMPVAFRQQGIALAAIAGETASAEVAGAAASAAPAFAQVVASAQIVQGQQRHAHAIALFAMLQLP